MPGLQPYRYRPLPPQCIRIIDLQPGQPHEPLVCRITIQTIGERPYNALSYVWGDPTHTTCVRCNNESYEGELGVGANLAEALTSFRLTDKPRRIWADALCINQQDLDERQSQVRLMGAVFGEAEEVLCWLGCFNAHDADGARARLAISLLRKFNENPHETLLVAHRQLHFDDDRTEADEELLNSWLTIKELFDIEYFHRTWIIQEVGLARRARCFWGSQEVWLDWKEVAEFCSFMDRNGASIINHLQLKSWVANHINLVWAKDSSGKSLFNFVEVLHWARVHHATDARDCVYSLLSHPSAMVNGALLSEPNYTITTATTYTNLAVNFIEQIKSLRILAFVDHQEEPEIPELPTWVPDWHALNLVAPLRYPTQASTDMTDTVSIINSDRGMILKCRGFLIDTISATSERIEPSELTATTFKNEMQKKTPFLIDSIWHKLAKAPGLHTDLSGFIASLSVILTGGYLGELDATSGQTQGRQQSDFAALILDYERIKPKDHPGGFYKSLQPEAQASLRAMASEGSPRQFVQDMTWNAMCRKVFRTAKGHFGLGPRTLKEGDLCVVLLGAIYPMVLRKRGDYFQLVGPALLYGFMNGEAEKLGLDGHLVEQEFNIL
jgi:hypothetical protein